MYVLGTNILGHFDDQIGNLPFGSNVDVFGMFGRSRTPWWKKENVCVKREVLEEEDDQPKNINIVSSMASRLIRLIIVSKVKTTIFDSYHLYFNF